MATTTIARKSTASKAAAKKSAPKADAASPVVVTLEWAKETKNGAVQYSEVASEEGAPLAMQSLYLRPEAIAKHFGGKAPKVITATVEAAE